MAIVKASSYLSIGHSVDTDSKPRLIYLHSWTIIPTDIFWSLFPKIVEKILIAHNVDVLFCVHYLDVEELSRIVHFVFVHLSSCWTCMLHCIVPFICKSGLDIYHIFKFWAWVWIKPDILLQQFVFSSFMTNVSSFFCFLTYNSVENHVEFDLMLLPV